MTIFINRKDRLKQIISIFLVDGKPRNAKLLTNCCNIISINKQFFGYEIVLENNNTIRAYLSSSVYNRFLYYEEQYITNVEFCELYDYYDYMELERNDKIFNIIIKLKLS